MAIDILQIYIASILKLWVDTDMIFILIRQTLSQENIERVSTIDAVTQNNQMDITIQKFRKEEILWQTIY